MALARAQELGQWLAPRFVGLQFEREKRNIFSVGCFHAALEYQAGILTLIAAEMPGAAFALTRSIFEAVVRGFWLRYCANDVDLDRFSKDEDIGQFGQLIAALEQVDGFGVGILLGIKTRSWKVMNSFTHTGISQIARRYSEEFVEANYADDEISEVINFSCAMGCVAAIAICEVANNNELASSIFNKTKELGFGG